MNALISSVSGVNHLHGAAEIVAATLLLDHRLVNLPVVSCLHFSPDRHEALVVPEVEGRSRRRRR